MDQYVSSKVGLLLPMLNKLTKIVCLKCNIQTFLNLNCCITGWYYLLFAFFVICRVSAWSVHLKYLGQLGLEFFDYLLTILLHDVASNLNHDEFI